MESIASKVTIPPVRVKLHWPDRWCSYCLQEVEEIPPKSEIYVCLSCRRVSSGRTQYIDAEVIPVARGLTIQPTNHDSGNWR